MIRGKRATALRSREGSANISVALCHGREVTLIPGCIFFNPRRDVTTNSNLEQKRGDASRVDPVRESLIDVLADSD